jgi:di/tricarboxylate transporter
MAAIIGAPPNALAFAAQAVETKDLAHYGTLVSLIGIVIMLAVLFWMRAIHIL